MKYLFVSFALLVLARGAEPAQETEVFGQKWTPFFEAAKETPLQKVARDADHLEVRIWNVRALWGGFESAFLRRDAGKWSAFTWAYDERARTLNRNEVPSGTTLEKVWDAMCAKGLLTLPDFSSLPRDHDYSTDGHTIIVETLVDGKYRTYAYTNPEGHDHEEARAIEAIYAIVGREFYGRETKEVPRRKFLTDAEVKELAEVMSKLNYPLSSAEFLRKLPFDLEQRGLNRHGEWRLTTGVSQSGFFFLREKRDGQTVQNAQVVFYRNTDDEDERVLKAGDDPAKLRADVPIPQPRSPAATK